MKAFLFLFLSIYLNVLMAQDCLPINWRIKEAKMVTGIGWTPEEALANLYKELPKIGILQTIKIDNTRVKTENDFSDTTKLTSGIKVNLDMISTFNCRINNQYAVSAIVPLNKIDYLPYPMTRDILCGAKIDYKKEFFEFDYAKRLCGHETYTLVFAAMNEIELLEGKIAKYTKYCQIKYYAICGNFKAKVSWKRYYNFEFKSPLNKYNLIYIGVPGAGFDIRDFSQELHLEMIKNAMN
jgi:hypothetical protein